MGGKVQRETVWGVRALKQMKTPRDASRVANEARTVRRTYARSIAGLVLVLPKVHQVGIA